MKDQEARGIVLKRLYDMRDAKQPAELSNFTETGLTTDTVARIIEQLAHKGLIDWHPVHGGINSPSKYLALMARINPMASMLLKAQPVHLSQSTSMPA